MKKVSFADMECSVARALDEIGEWWTLLILRDAILGVTRFDDFANRLGIARNVLSARLERLVDNGILEKVPYEDSPRARSDYRLTPKGKALWPVLTVLRQWGDEWIVGEGEEPVLMHHRACDHHAKAELHCSHCGERLVGREIRVDRGPGLTDESLLPTRA